MYLYADTEWMVALATLSTGQKTAFRTKAKTPTHHTHVLELRKTLVVIGEPPHIPGFQLK